jgi:aryl-alcohol dehydrogenase-like predicted oxidoreductase
MPYGRTNSLGQPDAAEADSIIGAALTCDIDHLDTAQAYGTSEAVIGRYLAHASELDQPRIATKIQIAKKNFENERELTAELEQLIDSSLRRLKVKKIPILYFHSAADYLGNKRLIDRVIGRKQFEDRVVAWGVSVYTPEEGSAVLGAEMMAAMQIPCNILDRRWQDWLMVNAQTVTSRAFNVHVRSVFLQGLCIADSSSWPKWFADANDVIERLESLVLELRRRDRIDLCLAYARGLPGVSSIVLGVASKRQWDELWGYSHSSPLTGDELLYVSRCFRDLSNRILDPSKW